ncbi:MAG TPA: hypothetical protein VI039_07095 [Solirubrobacterales bacterium]
MNPLAPGPYPGTPIFEWHTQTVRCGTSFTDAEAEEAARRRQKEIEQRELRAQRQREAERRIANLERERNEALHKLPAVDSPSPMKNETASQGCAIGCGLWAGLLCISLVVLGATGQFDSDDPRIFGVDNPLLFLPATWVIGWTIALIRLPIAKRRHRNAEAEADRRASEHARVQADFDRRIAAARRAA